ncbi:MAG: beta-ketoacyl synthase N-terminal-like domain-containing protein, partial [bacterium JZ-2024 1]
MARACVVVTGLGAVSPYGIGVDTLWNGLSKGENAIRFITEFETLDLCCQVGAPVPPFEVGQYIDRRYLVGMDIFEILGVVAAQEALKDSGLAWDEEKSYRLAVVGGSAIGGMTV